LNLAIERLLPYCNSKGTTVPAAFRVYTDRLGNQIITLPRELETIEAGAYQAANPDTVNPGTFWCGRPIPVQNQWYSYIPEGPGLQKGSNGYQGFKKLAGKYTTFIDWDEPMMLRVKLEEDESPGKTILFRGRLNGAKIYTNGSEGVGLAFTNATVTTTQTFDEPPYQIVKPITKGRIKLYAVDADGNETIAGWYDPDETNPSYPRFTVPVCEATT
jgi:hypothetical protein